MLRLEDIERLRRSLAMSPSLPPDQLLALVDAHERLLAERAEVRAVVEALERAVSR